MRFAAALVMVVAMLAAGCTSTADDTTTTVEPSPTTSAPTTSDPATTTEAPTTTAPTTTTEAPTTTAVTTTTEAATTTTTPTEPFVTEQPLSLAPPAPLPGSNGASGSGCAPGAGPLPDGIWFGFGRTTGATAIDFDLACFYFGDIAYDEGAADGEEVANDYYIRNQNPTLRTVPVSADAVVWTLGTFDGVGEHTQVPYTDWPAAGATYIECPGDFCLLWLYVNDGEAAEIVEQFVP